MKTTQRKSKTKMHTVNSLSRRDRLRLVNREVQPSPASSEHPGNRWPTQQEMLAVSKRLARISQEGMRREVAGDYFKSGELAYQLGEIIRTTDALFKQIKRL